MKFDKSAPVEVTYRPNGTGAFVTNVLPSASFASDWSLNANMGDWKGCFNYSALITFTAVVHMPKSPKPPVHHHNTPPPEIPNTGPGSVIGLFAGVTALAGLGHYFVSKRRKA